MWPVTQPAASWDTYIQVHPTFLYESFGCLVVLAIMLLMFKKRKFKGQVAFTYMIGYGILRAFVESLRTDQLLIWNTNVPVSVLVSAAMALAGVILMIVFARKARVAALAGTEEGAALAPDLSEDEEADASDEDTDDADEDENESSEAESSDEGESTDDESEEQDDGSSESAADEETDEDDQKPTEEDLWS